MSARLLSFFIALLNSVNNQQMNTFFLTVFDDKLTLKQGIVFDKSIRLKPPQLGVDCYCGQSKKRHS